MTGLLFVLMMQAEVATGAVEFLQQYGGWGISIILGGVVVALAKAYVKARDSEIATLNMQNKELIALTVKTTETNLDLKNALQAVASAMQSMDRRLEDVERKLEKS